MIPTFLSVAKGTVLLWILLFANVFLLLQFHTSKSGGGSDVAFAPRYVQAGPAVNAANAEASFSSYRHNLPLFEAVKSNNLQLVQSLLQHINNNNHNNPNTIIDTNPSNYNVNAEDPQGITPIIEASLLGNIEMVKLLLAHGATAQPAPGFRHTPLRAACLTANLPLIQLLVDRGADVNAQSEGGRTPLMGACYLRPQFDALPNRSELSFQTCQLMLQLGANPHLTNSFGESALDLCEGRGYKRSVGILKKWWNEKRYARIGAASRR